MPRPRKLTCPHCPKHRPFKNNTGLSAHMRWKHPDEPLPLTVHVGEPQPAFTARPFRPRKAAQQNGHEMVRLLSEVSGYVKGWLDHYALTNHLPERVVTGAVAKYLEGTE